MSFSVSVKKLTMTFRGLTQVETRFKLPKRSRKLRLYTLYTLRTIFMIKERRRKLISHSVSRVYVNTHTHTHKAHSHTHQKKRIRILIKGKNMLTMKTQLVFKTWKSFLFFSVEFGISLAV